MLLAVMLVSVTTSFANTEPTTKVKPEASLTTQIYKLLEKNSFSEKNEGQVAKVLFMLNANNEIVVLEVATEDATLERFVKNRLNYQAVNFETYEKGKKYIVDVRVAI